MVGEFSDTFEVSVALDLNTDKDEVVDLESRRAATLIYSGAVGETAIVDNKGDNFAGEVHMLSGVLDIIENGSARGRERSR